MSELLTYLSTHEDAFRKARLAALYSDFRHLRTTNPDGYIANVEAWQKGLTDAARDGLLSNRGMPGNLFLLKVDEELLRALETKEWGRPLALGTVIRDAIGKKEMIPLNEFATTKESIYRKSWIPNPWKIMSWGFRQMGLGEVEPGHDTLPTGSFVLMANLEAATKVLNGQTKLQTGRTDRIYTKKLFRQEFSTIFGENHPISEDDMDVFLKFMARDKSMIAYDGQTIKFAGSSGTNSSITPEDTTIGTLKTLMSDLEVQVNQLGKRAETLKTSARDAVSRNNKVLALAALRSKKLVESNLSRQSATLCQLEEVYSKIGQASDQIELVSILEGSTGVLKHLNAEVGGVERVDNIVDELKEQMTQVDEISHVMSEPGQASMMGKEDEIDDELEAMAAEDEHKREVAERSERERAEAAETKRQLDILDTWYGEEDRTAANQISTGNKSSQVPIQESVIDLERISLEKPKPVITSE